MASVDARQDRLVRPHAHPEVWLSINFALGGALLATAFFWGGRLSSSRKAASPGPFRVGFS
jgi:hypothetical protein